MLTIPASLGSARFRSGDVYQPLLEASLDLSDFPSLTRQECESILESKSKCDLSGSATFASFERHAKRSSTNAHQKHVVLHNVTMRRMYSDEKFGMMLTKVHDSVIVILVRPDSMAARAGMRFGDEILAIDDIPVRNQRARDVATHIVSQDQCRLTVRKQPHVHEYAFLASSSGGRMASLYSRKRSATGIKLNNGVVSAVESGSPAELAGVPTDHVVVAVNNDSVVGLSDKEIKKRLSENTGLVVIVHTIPKETFEAYVRGVKDVQTLRGGQ